MADFCKQCSEELYGENLGDLKGLEKGRRKVLCEGCGFTLVDEEGRCISPYCPKHSRNEEGGQP